MRKLSFLLLTLVVSISCFSQDTVIIDQTNDTLNMRKYEKQYLMPPTVRENLKCLDVFIYILRGWHTYETISDSICHYDYFAGGGVSGNAINPRLDFAQPYHTDTTIKIVGVAGYIISPYNISYQGSITEYGDENIFLEIRDSSLTEIKRSIPITSDSTKAARNNHYVGIPHYTELFFDTPLIMKGSFNVVYDDTSKYANDVNNRTSGWIFGSFRLNEREDNLAKIHNWRNQWDTLSYFYNTFAVSQREPDWLGFHKFETLFLFPIIDTSFSGTAYEDSVSLGKIGAGERMNIFPNPATEKLNIQSNLIIDDIEIFNSLGQTIEKQRVGSNSAVINTDGYLSGEYFIKIITSQGVTTKKFIKQ